jgi:hypothetical protein
MVTQKSRRPGGCLIFIITVVVGIVILVVVFALASSSHKPTKFNATVDHLTVLNPAEVSAEVVVYNVGHNAGGPTCLISLDSPGGTYHGFDSLKGQSIAAGGTATFDDTIVVTHQGADFVTLASSSVSCSN